MAKSTNVSGTDKALIDKLAAEFSDELNNLGVRVANLERNADKVKWTGEMRTLYTSQRDKQADGSQDKENTYKVSFRLFPTAEVNDHWSVKARLTSNISLNEDSSNNSTKLTFVHADGTYGNFQVKLGKQELFSDETEGMLFDDFFSGAKVTFGKDVKGTVEAGRISDIPFSGTTDPAADYVGLQVNANEGKLTAGAGYRYLKFDGFKTSSYSRDNSDKAKIWSVGGRYAFDNNVSLGGAYAENPEADYYEKAGNVSVNYKGAGKQDAGSWGAWVSYRHLGKNVAFIPTYDTYDENTKGWEVGTEYTLLKNVKAWGEYFQGKKLDTDRTAKYLFGRLSFYF
jgi:hypothetical protein